MNSTFLADVYFSNTKYEVLCAISFVTSPKKNYQPPKNKNTFVLFYATLNDLTLEVWLFKRLL